MQRSGQWLKREISVAIAILVVGSVLGGVPLSVGAQDQSAQSQETEPNDDPAGGTPVTSEKTSGALDPAKLDWDWYVVRAEQGETIEATLNFETVGNADFEMDLRAPNGTSLDSANGQEKQLGVAARASKTGFYYVGITSYYPRDENASPNTLPYTLTASPVMDSVPPAYQGSPDLADQPRSEKEPNDDRNSAMRVRGAPVTATMSSDDDVDWFAIHAEKGQRIEALIEFDEFNNDSYQRMSMQAPNGSYIGPFESSQTDRRAEIATIAHQTGTYLLQLSPTRPPTNASYTLTMYAAGGAGNTTESTTGPPNTTASATTSDSRSTPQAFPPGYGTDIPNTTRAIEQHFSTLFSYESFTFTSQSPFLVSSGPGIRRVSYINITNRTGFATINSSIPGAGGHARREYWTNGTYYAVFDSFNDTVGYQGYPQTFQRYLERATGGRLPSSGVIPNLLTNARFELVERIYGESETYFRYNSTEPTNGTELLPVLVENTTVDDFNASIVVDENGVIRSSAYSITYTRPDGTQATARASTRVTAINRTTARNPPWLPEAKASLATTNNSTVLGINGSVENASELGAITANTTTGRPGDTTGGTTASTASATALSRKTAAAGTPTTDAATTGTETTVASAGTSTATTSSSGAGFGPGVGIVALLAAALIALRRR